LIKPFLTGTENAARRKGAEPAAMFENGRIRLSTAPLHTVVVAVGTPVEITRCKCSKTGKYLKEECLVQI